MATRYDGDERRDQSWHLDKKVPVSLIIAMVAQVVAVTWFFAELKQDIELLKAEVAVQKEADKYIMEIQKDDMKIIQGHYARLEAKLDRLIEREKVK